MHRTPEMQGNLMVEGRVLRNAGFMAAGLTQHGIAIGRSVPIFTRGMDPDLRRGILEAQQKIERGDVGGDINQLLAAFANSIADLERGVTSSMTAFPVRENLEAESKILVPLDTPVRNMLPRTPGSGVASAWKQTTSLGGGWGYTTTTVTTGASSATQTVGATAGMVAGDTLYFTTTGAARTISSVTNTTVVVLMATISTTTAEVVTLQGAAPGGGAPAQFFFSETGAPATHTTVYADKSGSYKLAGSFGSVSIFAMAAGSNFQNQYNTEKRNAILNTMLNEENALINADHTLLTPPWGDGSVAYAYDGILKSISTASPAAQVQASVGALTTAHMDAQLRRIWNQGGQDQYIIANAQEILSLVHLAEASGSIIRVTANAADPSGVLGFAIKGYMHPITGQIVPVHASRFCPAGTMIFGSKGLADGTPAADVDVLPQVQLPELAPNESIQGYVAQELAPTTAAPQVLPFLVSVFSVFRMKGATVFASSSGITAV